MNEKKIKEIFSDEEFVKSLLEMEEPQQVQEALKEKGLALTIEEIEATANLLNRAANDELTETEKKIFESYKNGDTELGDEELETVSGGFIITISTTIGCIIAWSAVVGGAGFGIGALGFGAAKTHQATRGRW